MSITRTYGAACLASAVAASAWADPVTLDFEALDQSGVYGGAGWDAMNTTRLDDQFIASGIDFGGTTSGWNHDTILPGIAGADGMTSLVNAYRIGGTDMHTTIEMSAVGTTWDAFSMLALSLDDSVSMSAFDSGGGLLETIVLGDTLSTGAGSGSAWQLFAFSVSGIARVEVSGPGGEVLIDTIHYDPLDLVVVPLPSSGALALAGFAAVGLRSRRRS